MVGENMPLQFSKGEEEIADLFWDIGLKRNTARVLVIMIRGFELTSREMERVCDLRQPEVSIALTDLLGRKWVRVVKHVMENKGRPVKIFQMVKSLDDILDELKSAIVGDFDEKVKEIEKVREMLKVREKELDS